LTVEDLGTAGARVRERAAELLVEGFADHWPDAWPDIASARREVAECLSPGRICRAAFDRDGRLLGWVGAISGYGGNVWELHPLVVDPARQGRGIGRRLVADLVAEVRGRGGLTLWAGSDDEDGMTSLSGVDLYDDPMKRIASIRNLKRHPYEFYRKVGFVIVGVVPDANGRGRPDILLARPVG